MLLAPEYYIWILFAFFVVALLYSSVGFGGGSSYLAILTLVFTSFFVIRSTALLCNIIVVSGSCYLFYKRGIMDFKKFLPFIITSIPLAFIGATFRLKEAVFFGILGAVLIISSVALVLQATSLSLSKKPNKKYPPYITYILGAAIGFISGLVGIGGGIFLAPILNHMRWDSSLKIAALASFFILVNSLSGIFGLIVNETFEVPWLEVTGLLLAVLVGGQLGIRLSLSKLTGNGIKLLTAILVLFVGVRVLLINGLGISFGQ